MVRVKNRSKRSSRTMNRSKRINRSKRMNRSRRSKRNSRTMNRSRNKKMKYSKNIIRGGMTPGSEITPGNKMQQAQQLSAFAKGLSTNLSENSQLSDWDPNMFEKISGLVATSNAGKSPEELLDLNIKYIKSIVETQGHIRERVILENLLFWMDTHFNDYDFDPKNKELILQIKTLKSQIKTYRESLDSYDDDLVKKMVSGVGWDLISNGRIRRLNYGNDNPFVLVAYFFIEMLNTGKRWYPNLVSDVLYNLGRWYRGVMARRKKDAAFDKECADSKREEEAYQRRKQSTSRNCLTNFARSFSDWLAKDDTAPCQPIETRTGVSRLKPLGSSLDSSLEVPEIQAPPVGMEGSQSRYT